MFLYGVVTQRGRLMEALLGFGLLFVMKSAVLGYELGAPETICINHVPHHSHLPQQFTESPYAIQVIPDTYDPGDILTVRLYSLDNEPFRGYQVRAQQVGGDIEKFIGTFIEVPEDSKPQSWYPEDIETHNCFTHTNNKERTLIEAKWQAPNISVGDVIFRGTIVKDFEYFWANITSNVLRANHEKEMDYTPHTVSTKFTNYNFLDDCGETKGCMLYPKGCSSECTHAVAYQADTDQEMIQFEIFVKNTPAYVSLGFSEDLIMGNDSTVSCVAVDEYREVHYGYSPAYYNERHKLNASLLQDMAVERKGDSIYCSFKRSFTDDVLKYDFITHAPYFVHFDFTVKQYLQLAWGGSYYKTPIPWKHDELPLISSRKLDLSKIEKTYADQIPDEYKVHGSLGITGWIFLGSLGMLISRHFRPEMTKSVGKGFFSRPIWFHLHFWAMVLCLVLASIAVIIMFVYLEAWTKRATVHAIFGLIAVGFGLVNILAGLVRPNQAHKMRPVFTWAHRLMAVLGFIAAWVAVFLGANAETIGENLQTDATIVLIVWLILVVVIEALFEIFNCWGTRKDAYTIDEKGDGSKTHPVKWILFAAFVVISTALFIAFIYVFVKA